MDAFKAIGLAFMDQLTTIGLFFILFGMMIRFLPKWSYFKWCVEARENLIKEAQLRGDFPKMEKLKREINAIEKKLPIQGRLLACVGALILIVSLLLQNH